MPECPTLLKLEDVNTHMSNLVKLCGSEKKYFGCVFCLNQGSERWNICLGFVKVQKVSMAFSIESKSQ